MSTVTQYGSAAAAASGPAPATGPAAGRPARRRGRRGPGALVALHATLLAATAIAVSPVLWIVFVSLGPGDSWQQPGEVVHHPGPATCRFVLLHSHFPQWFLNSVIVAAATTALGVLIAAGAGYAISRMRFPGHWSLMRTFLLTQMFPVAVLIVPLYNLMARFGLIDSHLGLVLVNCTLRTFASDQRANGGAMTAASVVIAIPAGLVLLLVQRHLVTGLTAGGTKG